MGWGVRSEYMDQAPDSRCHPARGTGKQKPAKRPETKEGGREEEELRLGIASTTVGRRLRSAKTVVSGDVLSDAATHAWSAGKAEKFRVLEVMSLSGVLACVRRITVRLNYD
jgi:hypothetical protein